MKEKFRHFRNFKYLIIIAFLFAGNVFISCENSKEEYFTEADFKTMNKIDIHCHVNTKNPAFMEQADADNFRILTINTDAPLGVTIEEQRALAVFQKKAFPQHLEYLTTFSLEGWENEDWAEKTIAYLEESFKMGAIGVKVWKNIGMVEKNKDNQFIMIDDPKIP